MSSLFELIAEGGWLMAPIAACSVVGLALFLERLWALQRSRVLPERFLELAGRLIQEGRWSEAEALCHNSDTPAAAVLAAGVRYAGRDRGLIKTAMEEAGRRELFFLERFTSALGAIATIAPLLGLLGTVIGMIQMFRQVVSAAAASEAAVDVELLAGGIWQALLTTAAGLIVAIPVFLSYRYVLSRVDRFAVDLEAIALRALDSLVAPEQRPRAGPDESAVPPSEEPEAPIEEAS